MRQRVDKVRAFFLKHNIKDTEITVALSGGSDSVALLFSLLDIRDEFNITVTAAHLNHNIRGEEAVRDENFVKQLCKNNGIHLYCESLDIADLAKKEQKGLEETARKYRYQFLNSVSKGYLATAHNKNDNAETILLNIIRGSGVKGACGMDEVTGKLIRPLLSVQKEEIMNYLEERNLSYVTDSTNKDTDYSRNRVRLKVLPELQAINPEAVSAIVRFSDSAREYDSFVTEKAEKLLKKAKVDNSFKAEPLNSAHSAVRYKAVSILLKSFAKQNIEYRHYKSVERILKEGGKINLPNNFFVQVKDGFLTLYKNLEEAVPFSFPFDINKVDYGNFSLDIKQINRAEFENKKKSNNLLNILMLDYDKIPDEMFLRSKKEGDRYSPFGSNVTKSLKKLFIDAKIPLAQRKQLIVFEGDNNIVAVEKFGASSQYGVDDSTKRILQIRVLRED